MRKVDMEEMSSALLTMSQDLLYISLGIALSAEKLSGLMEVSEQLKHADTPDIVFNEKASIFIETCKQSLVDYKRNLGSPRQEILRNYQLTKTFCTEADVSLETVPLLVSVILSREL